LGASEGLTIAFWVAFLRCARKYGDDWVKYAEIVPYR